MAATKYSKRPEMVDALQYIGTNLQEVLNFAPGVSTVKDGVLYVVTLAGQCVVANNWWILKDVGDVYSIFGPNFLDYYKPGGGP
jgi:hypothetical protein